LPVSKLARYGSAMIGADFDVPRAAQWRRPRPAMIRHLRHLYSAGIDAIERRSNASIDRKTAHGLEQQLIEAVVECLSDGSAIEATGATGEHQDVVARFEALLEAQPKRHILIGEISSTLGVSAQTLRISCAEQLGMGPAEYVRRRRIQLVHGM
jgi:AraC-like DNA-binding protein